MSDQDREVQILIKAKNLTAEELAKVKEQLASFGGKVAVSQQQSTTFAREWKQRVGNDMVAATNTFAKEFESAGATQVATTLKMLGAVARLGDGLVSLSRGVGSIKFSDMRQGLNDVASGAGLTFKNLGAVGSAGAILGAGYAGWQVGRMIGDFTGLTNVIGDAATRLMGFDKALQAQTAGAKADAPLLAAAQRARAAAQDVAIIANFQRELDSIDSKALAGLEKALESHMFSISDLAKRYNISEGALALFQDRLKKQADVDKAAADSTKRLADERARADEAYQKSLRSIVDTLSGGGAIDQANLWLQALSRTLPVTQMTREAQEQVNRVMGEAIAAYAAFGETAPDAIQRVFLETSELLKLPKIGGLIEGMKGQPLELFSAPNIPQMMAGLAPSAKQLAASLAGTFRTPILDGMKNLFAKDVPNSLIAAIQGGGNPVQAVGATIGQHIGNNIGEHIGQSVAQKAGSSLGSKIGGLIGNVVPIIGPIVGALGGKLIGAGIGKIKDLFSGGEGAKVNDMRDQFIAAAGGLDALNRKAHDAGTTLDKLLAAKKVKDFESAVNDLNGKMGNFADEQKQDQADLEAAIQRYGFSIEELGPKMRQQKLDEQAQLIMNDFRLLAGSGIDVGVVIDKMGGSINEFIANALRTGSEIPASMKPMLEKMIEMGTLTDDSGNKISSLEGSGLKFSETLTQGFEKIAKKFDQLLEGLGLIPQKTQEAIGQVGQFKAAIGAIKDLDVNINAHWNIPPPPEMPDQDVPGAAAGGLFTRATFRVIAEREPEIVGSPNVIVNALTQALQRVGGPRGEGSDPTLVDRLSSEVSRLRDEIRRSHQMLPNALLRAVRDGGMV